MPQGDRVDQAPPERAAQWVEEQRRLERDQAGSSGRELERLAQHGRDLEARVGLLEAELAQQRSMPARLSAIEDALRQAHEAMASLQQQVAENREQTEHQTLLRTAEAERDRRALAELGQRLTELQRAGDGALGRIQALAEEAKRDRASVAQAAAGLDGLASRQLALGSRIQQVEEMAKRTDGQLAAAQQRDEQVRAELARLDNWQRLADVRWNRQVGEWQQQLQTWKAQVEEVGKPIQQLIRQAARLQSDLEALAAQLAEHQKRIDEQSVALQRLDGMLAIIRESGSRLEQGVEAQRRRADEQSASLFRLEERLQSEAGQVADLARRIDAQDARIEETRSLIRAVDTHRERIEGGVAATQRQLAEARADLAQQIAQAWERLGVDRQRVADRLERLTQALLQQNQRWLAAFHQDVDLWTALSRAGDEPEQAEQASPSPASPGITPPGITPNEASPLK